MEVQDPTLPHLSYIIEVSPGYTQRVHLEFTKEDKIILKFRFRESPTLEDISTEKILAKINKKNQEKNSSRDSKFLLHVEAKTVECIFTYLQTNFFEEPGSQFRLLEAYLNDSVTIVEDFVKQLFQLGK